MDYLMAIDLGSTSLKAVIYDLDGNRISSASRPTEKITPKDHPEWVTWEPDQIWQGGAAAAKEALSKIDDPALVKAVAVTGMGMDGVPIDKNGNHLYPFISWHDPRTAPQAEWWNEHVGAEKTFSIAGFPTWAITAAMRVLWMNQHEPEIMDKAFDPYFSTKPEGSGLGLATAYAIIRKHGGHIAVDSVMGQGTTVTLYLPAVKRKAAQITTPKEQTRMGLGRILVMDDESYILEMLQHGLTGMGYEVTLSRDGAAAVNEYVSAMQQGQPYDVVIMDLTIPGAMGGREAIKKLLRADPEVKAIVASGYSNDPVMAAPEEHGFKGVLAKPFTLDSISRMVNQVMGQK